jgi:GMP synthase (glutamine-hydrolysing)
MTASQTAAKIAVAIRHVAFEGLGSFEPILRKAGYTVRYYDGGVDDLRALDPLEADLLIALGGPIGAYEENKYPFLADELLLLQRRLAANRPTFGICLGAQLMARALGARVYPGAFKEIGWAPINLTKKGLSSPLRHLAKEGAVLHWHGDTFDLPGDADLLASTEFITNQAFSLGPNVLGLQFHAEAVGSDIERWLIGHAVELGAARVDLDRLRADTARFGGDLPFRAHLLLWEWIQGLDCKVMHSSGSPLQRGEENFS